MIRLWDVEVSAGDDKKNLFKQSGIINSAVFSSDGTKILTAGNDSTARLWNVSTGKEIESLQLETTINYAVFSPDGTKRLTACDDSTARLWEIEGDLDLPASLFELHAKATTGVEYVVENSKTRCIPAQTWLALKEKYNNRQWSIIRYVNTRSIICGGVLIKTRPGKFARMKRLVNNKFNVYGL